LPNCFSICARARSIALFFSAFSSAIHLSIFLAQNPLAQDDYKYTPRAKKK
jgi:hypothetical protein